MATTYQNRSHPIKYSNVRKTRTKKSVSQPTTSTIANNNSKGIQIRFGNNSSQNSMYKPPSILKKKTFGRSYIDNFNENIMDSYQPSSLELLTSRPFYSPIHTPPRLRTLITPPGVEPYRNRYNLRQINSPLPALDTWYSPPVSLDTWGLQPIDYRLNSNLNLIRPYPSPLSHYGLGSGHQRQKKSYIVVPRLTNLVSPPVSSGDGTFTLPSRRIAPVYVPDSQYTYLERIHSFTSPRFHREPSDYVYVRRNEAFANGYIEDFIGKYMEDQLIPDLLLEIIGELDEESNKRGDKSRKTDINRYYTELNRRMNQNQANNTHLLSDDWIRELDYQHPPISISNIDSNTTSLKPLDFREIPPARTTQVRYHDLPSDVQGRLLADINQELIDFEVKNMMTELSDQTLDNRFQNIPATIDTRRGIESNRVREVMHDTYNIQTHRSDQVQYNLIDKYAENKLLDTICLDNLIVQHIKQSGSIVDVDDLSRLLDVTILGNLIYEYQEIDESRSRTLDSYGSKKFHLNSFMNITMDLLLTELSASLIEDMKDLDEQERRTF